MKRIAAILLAALMPFGAAQAAVTLSTGESAVFNFDLTGASPAPPYDGVRITFGWGDQSGDSVFTESFPELEAGGSRWDALSGFYDVLGSSSPGILDGEFSIRVTSLSGTFSLEPFVEGFLFDGDSAVATQQVYGTLAKVPAPAPLALLGIGLAGLAASRRRRH